MRRSMQGNRRRDTKPEVAVRRLIHGTGLRYRVDFRPIRSLNRRADIAFPRLKIAVFIDGCFWHGCPEHITWPVHNSDWWRQKIAATQRRDAETDEMLQAASWTSVRVW
ncbi:MAG: very short patch repair endonuclease, partial [Sphingomicrobium sp.]